MMKVKWVMEDKVVGGGGGEPLTVHVLFDGNYLMTVACSVLTSNAPFCL